MRKRKWLLVVILIILLINIAFWSINYFFDINKYVEKIVTERIGKNLDADITFSKLNVTSKILQITDLNLVEREGAYSFRAKQLYIQFSFWKFVFSGFNFTHALKEIRCFSPEFDYILAREDVQNMQKFDIDALEKILRRFDYISIINGAIKVIGESNVKFKQNLVNLNITLENHESKQWVINATADQKDTSGSITIQGSYKTSGSDYTVAIKNFLLNDIILNNGELSSAELNAEFKGTHDVIIDGNVNLSGVQTKVMGELFTIPKIDFLVKGDSLSITEPAIIQWRGNRFTVIGVVGNFFKKKPNLQVSINSEFFETSRLAAALRGKINTTINLQGSYTAPEIGVVLKSDSLKYNDFSFKSIEANLSFVKDDITLEKVSCSLNDNIITGQGNIYVDQSDLLKSELAISVASKNAVWNEGENTFSGNVELELLGTLSKPKLQIDISDLEFENKYIDVYDLNLEANAVKDQLNWSIQNPSRSIVMNGKIVSLSQEPTLDIELMTNDLSFNSILRENSEYIRALDPNILSQIKISMHKDSLIIKGFISFPEYLNTSLFGSIELESNLALHQEETNGFIQILSDSLIVNSEACPLFVRTEFQKDKRTLIASLKDIINVNITEVQSPAFGKKLTGFCSMDSVYIAKLNNLYPIFRETNDLGGIIDGKISFDTSHKMIAKGNIYLKQFSISPNITPVDANMVISADSQKVMIDSLNIKNSQQLLEGNGVYYLKSSNLEISAHAKAITLQDLIVGIPVTGTSNSRIVLTGKLKDPTILCDIEIADGSIYKTNFKTISAQFFQDNQMFSLNKLNVNSPSFTLSGTGTYSYNFLNEEFYNQPDKLDIHLEGDLLSELEKYIPAIKQASSKTICNFTLSTDETTTRIDSASFSISSGQFSIEGQPERIKNLNLQGAISWNVLTSLEGSFRMGDGKLMFDNIINNNDSDIYLGTINAGTLRFRTDEDGITIHIPEYQPERALVDTRLEGFQDKYFKVYNENGAWVLDGRIFLSNGDAIYEEPHKDEEYEPQDNGLPPIHARFDLIFEKNTWYVGSPFNLKIDNGNFMSFRTDPETEEFQLYFDLHSRQGDMRLFGEIFSAEDISVRKTRTDPKVNIDGEFIKRTPDGSMIYLYVKSTDDKRSADDIGTSTYGDVKVSLASDNPKDETMLSILSKIQYGKEIDDLSEEERFNLGTEQAINLASDKLSDLIFSPLISPVEGAVRQFLGLDFVRVRPGIMKNIIETSGIVDTDEFIFDREFDSDLELLGELSRDILLENLTIDLGKYITPDWYLNYEALIKKEMTGRNEVTIGVQHEFSLTWDLPYNFRFKYKYQFNPSRRKDNQGISLETVIHF